MAWKKAILTWEGGTGGAIRTQTVEVEMSEMLPCHLRNRDGFIRTRLNGTISHVNADRIVAIDEIPEPDPDKAVRAADGE